MYPRLLCEISLQKEIVYAYTDLSRCSKFEHLESSCMHKRFLFKLQYSKFIYQDIKFLFISFSISVQVL